MKKKNRMFLLGFVMALYCSCAVAAESYKHEIHDKGITMYWNVVDDELRIKVTAMTTGWVGVGFNPTEQMKGANYIVGYVKDGDVVLHDDFGDQKWNHREDTALGGRRDITVVGGEERDGQTTLEFALPLDSGDAYDGAIDVQGNTVLLLAYGGDRDSLRAMHAYRTSLTVNLATGKKEQ